MRRAIVVAILALGAAVPVVGGAAEPLGRLFFTPAERKALDAGQFAATQKIPDKPAPRTVRLDGVVTRSDSDRTVWVNGTAYHGGAPDGVQVKTNRATPASTTIQIPGKTAGTRVKVGQRLDLNSGQIREDLSRRAETEEAPAALPETPANGVVTEKSKMTSAAAPTKRDTDSGPAAAAR